MRNFTVSPVLVNGNLDRNATIAALNALMDKHTAGDTADLDLIGPVCEALFDSMPKVASFPSSMLIEACSEAAFEKYATEHDGEKPSITERVAIRNRIADVLPEYVKTNSDYLHLSKRAGVRVKGSLSEQNAGSEPRISDADWLKYTTAPAPKAPKAAPVAVAETTTTDASDDAPETV